MKKLNFVAVDFETAQSFHSKKKFICQIGLVVVTEGEITERLIYFVQPPFNSYDDEVIKVHHITPEKTADSPTFDLLWPKIKHYFVNTKLVAHNSTFDESVLLCNLEFYGIIPMGINGFTDTRYIFGGYALDDVCYGYDIDCSKHHDALFDAECCARIYLNYLNGIMPDKEKVIAYADKRRAEKREKGIVVDKWKGKKIDSELFIPDLLNADPESPFYGKKIVITGDFFLKRSKIAEMLKSWGADMQQGISKFTDYVLVGNKPGPSKLKEIEKLKYNGYNIKVLDEDDLRVILKDGVSWDPSKEVKKSLDLTYEHLIRNLILFNGRNVISSKELFFVKELKGNLDYLRSIAGCLGAFTNSVIDDDITIFVISKNTIDLLEEGFKDAAIKEIEYYYNKTASVVFNYKFITDSEIIDYCNYRLSAYGRDDVLHDLCDKYRESISAMFFQDKEVDSPIRFRKSDK